MVYSLHRKSFILGQGLAGKLLSGTHNILGLIGFRPLPFP